MMDAGCCAGTAAAPYLGNATVWRRALNCWALAGVGAENAEPTLIEGVQVNHGANSKKVRKIEFRRVFSEKNGISRIFKPGRKESPKWSEFGNPWFVCSERKSKNIFISYSIFYLNFKVRYFENRKKGNITLCLKTLLIKWKFSYFYSEIFVHPVINSFPN